MIISAWSKTSIKSDGELWVYPEISDSAASVTLRVVSEGRVIDWALAPDEAEMLMAILKKVADMHASTEPAPEPVSPPAPTEAPEPIGEVFVRQESQSARTPTLGEKFENVLDKLRP